MSEPIIWHSETDFFVGDLHFHCIVSDYHAHQTTGTDKIVILKGRKFIDRYVALFARFAHANVLELGIFQGGSALLLASAFDTRKIVGIDILPPLPKVLDLIAAQGLDERIRLHFEVSQGDAQAVREIVANEFDDMLDVIIDDASHQYALSKQAFDATFPLLRPGGIYVLEDWGWAHWQGGRWQSPDDPWFGQPALTNLLFQLVMANASRPDVIARIEVYPTFAVIVKGETPLSPAFSLDRLIIARGRSLTPI